MKKLMNPLEQWQDFERATIPATASLVQRVETQKAFYAGMHSMLSEVRECAEQDEDASVKTLMKWSDDLGSFFLGMVTRPYEVYTG